MAFVPGSESMDGRLYDQSQEKYRIRSAMDRPNTLGGQYQYDTNGMLMTPRLQDQKNKALAQQYVDRRISPVGDNDTQFQSMISAGYLNPDDFAYGAGGAGSGGYGSIGGVGGPGGGGFGGGGGMSPDLAKLMSDWQAKMDAANAANEGRYQQILGGYADRRAGMEGYGDQARADILRRGGEASAAVRSQLTQRGLGNTTVVPTMQMGAQRETEGNVNRLEDTLRQQRAGMDKERLDFMERRTDEGPSYGQMLELLKASGQGAGTRVGGSGSYSGGYAPQVGQGNMEQYLLQGATSPNIGLSYGNTEAKMATVKNVDRRTDQADWGNLGQWGNMARPGNTGQPLRTGMMQSNYNLGYLEPARNNWMVANSYGNSQLGPGYAGLLTNGRR
jgi:hypothetical protein